MLNAEVGEFVTQHINTHFIILSNQIGGGWVEGVSGQRLYKADGSVNPKVAHPY